MQKIAKTPRCVILYSMSAATNPPLLVIVGETASGKSQLAIQLAKRLNGELICADSWTVRREVDIGTAKPNQKDRQQVVHHLLDIVGPDEDFTAAVFKRHAKQAINDIATRGKLPIMVGGTGLYIDGVIYDYGFLPAGDRAARQELNQLSNQQLIDRIKAASLNIPDTVDTGNKRRLIRLLETKGQQPTKQHSIRPNTLIIGIRTDRQELEQRIIERVDGMIEQGLEQEVAQLANKYGWDCEALKGVGYAQWKGYFLGTESRDEVRQMIIKATKDLAKRQRTWFKRNKSIHWQHTPVKQQEIEDLITTELKT